MAQIAKIELQTEIKAPAEKFFNIFRSKAHIQPSICPNLIKDVQLLKGDWETVGSVKQWTYIAGKPRIPDRKLNCWTLKHHAQLHT